MQKISIIYKKVMMDVVYFHQPKECNDIDYPGSEEYIEIETIKISGVDVSYLLEEFNEEIEKIIFKELEK